MQSLGHREIEEAGHQHCVGKFSRKHEGSPMHELEEQQSCKACSALLHSKLKDTGVRHSAEGAACTVGLANELK